MTKRDWLELDEATRAALVAAARDTTPVSGLTHNHYKYPARFSPQFVRAAIEAFTDPGDLVFDPFVGGGTTLVEALANQRDAVGVDISSLAIFVSEAKTLLLDEQELDAGRPLLTERCQPVSYREKDWPCPVESSALGK